MIKMRTGIDCKGREWEEISLGLAKDLTNQTYTYLTALFRVTPPKTCHGNGAWWLFKCKCGNEVMGKTADVLRGSTTSCGCRQKELIGKLNFKDLTGQCFGKLVVLGYIHINNTLKWKCQCDCGNITEVTTGNLQSGLIKSCGCLRGFQSHIDAEQYSLIGQKFGYLTVIEKVPCPDNTHKAYYKCICDCGNETIAQAGALRSGGRCSCGQCNNKLSQGELKIKQILDENNIEYIYNKPYFKDLITSGGGIGRYDFILIKNNIPYRLIEFDGRQHFDPDSLYNILDDNYYNCIKQNDKIKNDYALKNSIPLVRLPYTQLQNITYETIMGNQFLVKET